MRPDFGHKSDHNGQSLKASALENFAGPVQGLHQIKQRLHLTSDRRTFLGG